MVRAPVVGLMSLILFSDVNFADYPTGGYSCPSLATVLKGTGHRWISFFLTNLLELVPTWIGYVSVSSVPCEVSQF